MIKRIYLLSAMVIMALGAMAQSLTVSGVVMAQDEPDPVIGANVVVKGTTVGTITDFDGNFTIEANAGDVLQVSFMGYKPQEVKVANAGPLRITLVPDNVQLQEVVAIGYGTMKKSDITGAVSSVKAEDLQKTPVATIDQALQGKAAGVTVNANSGQPGAAAEIRIRGIGSVKSDSRPIYVVDGVVLKDINFLTASDIESMEIMKDASSTAIYGSQAANGVILITTKSGHKDRKAAISFNAYWGMQNRWRKLDLMNAMDQAETEVLMAGGAKAIINWNKGFNTWWTKTNNPAGNNPYYPVNFDYGAYAVEGGTDWQDAVFRPNALVHNYSLSVDGGGDWGAYMISASYFSQDGTLLGSNFNRLTLRANTNFNVRKWLRIGENLTFVNSSGRNAMNNNASPQASVLSAAMAMAPWDPVYYPSDAVNGLGENIGGRPSAASNFTNVVNPMSMIYNTEPSNKVQRWVGDIFIEIKPVEGLTIRPSLSMDLSNNMDRTFNYAYRYSNADYRDHNSVGANMARYMTLTNDNVITYARDIKKHSFSIMAGETMQQYNYYSLGAGGQDIVNIDPKNWYIFNTKQDSTRTEGDAVARTRRLSFFTRLHYSYDNRYIATFNFRADASSKFKKSEKGVWGYFPSLALAWRINQEAFMEHTSDYLDNLKLRFGWGQVGNDQVAESDFVQSIMTPGPYFVGYILGDQLVPGAAVLTLVNENGRWETNEQWNLGLDFGFWNGMLNGTIEGYIRDTKDAILSVNAPAHIGNHWAMAANLGTVRNMGIEITLGHQNRVGDFEYGINANLSFAKNKVTHMNGGDADYGDRTKTDEGLPVRSFWGYKYLGVYMSDEEAAAHLPYSTNVVNEGDSKYEDVNNDGKIDENDCMVIGNPFPWLTGALTFNCGWKGIDFSINFQGVYGNQIYNALRERLEGTGQTCTLSSSMKDVHIYYNADKREAMTDAGIDWRAYMDKYNGSIPNPHGNSLNAANSSRFIEDGAYLRLKELTLGYTLPKKYSQKAYIDRIRVYFTASNLLTLTKYSGYDPEVGGGVDYGNYPQSRTFTFGLNCDF